LRNHIAPIVHSHALNESVFHLVLARMMRGKFNSKLAHAPAGIAFTMNCFRK